MVLAGLLRSHEGHGAFVVEVPGKALVVDAADPVLAWVERRYLALLSATAREVTSYTGVMVLSALPGKWCAAPPALHAVDPPPDQLAEGTA